MKAIQKIIISRTDNLGDVILTLPLAGILKSKLNVSIIFIGKAYTRPIIEACKYIDEFIDREDIIKNPLLLKNKNADAIIHVFPDKDIAKVAAAAKIPLRVGTSHRWFHWLYCNRRVNFSRNKSNLHEAQLNSLLLQPLGIHFLPSIKDISSYYGFTSHTPLNNSIKGFIDKEKINLIFHPKSKGSAREWPLENYYLLAKSFNQDYHIFVTGTENEGEAIKKDKAALLELPNVTDLTGKLSLGELISFIGSCNGLVACSTGPLHIGAALGKHVIGLYPPMKPIHPGRWAPIGNKAEILVLDKFCDECRKIKECTCIKSISVGEVKMRIEKWKKDQ